MENIEVVCVEVQENEDGEIVCVEKMDTWGEDTQADYCIMECDIASVVDHSTFGNDVQVIVFPDDSDESLDELCVDADGALDELCVKTVQENNLRTYVTSHRSDFNCISDKSRSSGSNADVLLKVTKENLILKVAGDNRPSRGGRHSENRNTKNFSKQLKTSESVNENGECYKEGTTDDKKEEESSRSSVNKSASSGTLSVRKTYHGAVPKKSESMKKSHRECLSKLPFRCKMCDKSFRQDSSLKIHLKVHAGKYSDICRLS